MATIYHQVGINGSSEIIYEKLTSLEGLAGWWTHDTRGDCSIGNRIEFYFNDLCMEMKVIELGEGKLVRWQCISGDPQWIDTEITFKLRKKDKQVLVDFTHDKWREASELFTHCSTKWAVFLLSLKKLIETGKGRPFPDDVTINYN